MIRVRIWVDVSSWPDGPGKSAYKYLMFRCWATDALLLIGLASCRMGIFGLPLGLFLAGAAVKIKYRHYKKIFAVKNRRYLRLPLFLSLFYLSLFWIYLAAEGGSPTIMITSVSVVFHLVMLGLLWKRSFQIEGVLHKYYPWIAKRIPPVPDVRPEEEDIQEVMAREKAAYEEIEKLYKTTENQIVKEAIEKSETAAGIFVLLVETLCLSLWFPIVFM